MSPNEIELKLLELGDRVRTARQAAGFTLVEFGKLCGLSASTIQKIESRTMVPSIAVAMKIAFGLGIHVGDLIAPSPATSVDIVVQRLGEHAELSTQDFGNFRLSANIVNSDLEGWRVTIEPESRFVMPRPQRTFEQVIVCERGCVEMDLDHVIYSLQAGDTLHSLEKSLYSLANPGKSRHPIL